MPEHGTEGVYKGGMGLARTAVEKHAEHWNAMNRASWVALFSPNANFRWGRGYHISSFYPPRSPMLSMELLPIRYLKHPIFIPGGNTIMW